MIIGAFEKLDYRPRLIWDQYVAHDILHFSPDIEWIFIGFFPMYS